MLDVLGTTVTSIFGSVDKALAYAIVAGLVRNLAGYGDHMFADGKLDAYEVKKLGQTILLYFVGIFMLSQGMEMNQALVGTFGIDTIKHLFPKKKE